MKRFSVLRKRRMGRGRRERVYEEGKQDKEQSEKWVKESKFIFFHPLFHFKQTYK
jgi:hypothetical protein